MHEREVFDCWYYGYSTAASRYDTMRELSEISHGSAYT